MDTFDTFPNSVFVTQSNKPLSLVIMSDGMQQLFFCT